MEKYEKYRIKSLYGNKCGVIYGMYAAKAGKTLNITKEEGQIVIDFIKSAFPKVIAMVEASSAFAKANGYVILNTRTNSRAWFPNLIRLIRGELDERNDFKLLSGDLSEARNIKIQGTQADMIKECTVELQIWIDANGYTDEITILSWVHDEVVCEFPDYLNGKCIDWHHWRYIENNILTFTKDSGEIVEVEHYGELKRLLMIEVCNRYLTNVSMDVDYDIEKFWTK